MSYRKIHILVFMVCLPLVFSCKKKDVDIEGEDEFDAYISEQMESQNIPALSALIFKENTILYEKYFGQSNVGTNQNLEANHVFLLASISKTITATALLRLYDDGEFNLNDPINDFLPFEVNVPGESVPITFKMLLTHTSGIADGSALDGQYYYGEDSPVELAYFIQNYLVSGGAFYNETENFHGFEPGSDVEYSNVGNALIAVLVEEISGQSFNAFCKAEIFEPMGMTNSFWRLDEISQPIVQPYNYAGGAYEAIGHYTFTDYPNGGLRSTGTDLFRFLTAIAQNGNSGTYELLKPATVSQMISLQIPDLDEETGLHFFIMNSENQLWGHDGGEQGVATIMGFNPSTKIGAIILTNQGEANLDQVLVEAYQLGLTL